jgi:hypothetical protein
MKQFIIILLILGVGYSISAQINFNEPFISLETSTPSDFFTRNQIRTTIETHDGFIYVNHETGDGAPFNPIIKKTNSNLELLDSIFYESLSLESLGMFVWGGEYDKISKTTILYGLDNGFFNHPTTFYKIFINEDFEVTEIMHFEYGEKIISIRKPVKMTDGGIVFLSNLTLEDDSNEVVVLKVSNDFNIINEAELPYGWSVTEGLTLSQDGNIHIALSTSTVTFDGDLNEIAVNEIEGLAQYEYTCHNHQKTVNLSDDNIYFAGVCQELYQDSISPWITLGELRRERIFKYNPATQTFQSFFNHVPFGYDFDYSNFVPFQAFDGLNPNFLYIGNNFYNPIDVNILESVFSINSVDSRGNLRWSKLFGSLEYYWLYDVIALEDEGVLLIIEGSFQDEVTDIVNRNVYYLKLDKDGNIAGTTNIPGLSVYDDYIKISPNPTTEYFQIENLQSWTKNTQIRIVNALGQTVQTQQMNDASERVKIDVSGWQPGVYYVQVFNEKGLINTQKVLVP